MGGRPVGRFAPSHLTGLPPVSWLKLVLLGGSALVLSGQETIRVDVRLVSILATVKAPSGEPVGGLDKADFSVSDNGVAQEIAVFERRTEQPLSVALLIDTSSSTAIKLKQEVDSITRFLASLFGEGHPGDSAALFSFNDTVTLQTSFSNRLPRFVQALKTLQGEGGTSLYDAIVLLSHELERREGRKVAVVVTDGADTTSVRTFHEALEAVQMADAVLYGLLVVPIANDPGRSIGGEHTLQQLADSTGGRMFLPTLGAELDRAFSEILKDLRTQYYLAFYPRQVPLTKNPFHRLEVKVARPGLRVLARTGYYGEAEGSAKGATPSWRRGRR